MQSFREFLSEESIWYHGTSDAFLPSIRATGLTPDKSGQGAMTWAMTHGLTKIPKERAVFVTQYKNLAARYAQLAADASNGRPIILTLKMPHFQGQHDPAELTKAGYKIPVPVPPDKIANVEFIPKHRIVKMFGQIFDEDEPMF